MTLKVVGLAGSPRRHGNTESLLDRVLAGAKAQGANTEKIILSSLDLAPCCACDTCFTTGVCTTEDDYQLVYAKMIDAERIVLAAPIFFTGLPAQVKALIDRCQCLWARKYILEDPLPPTRAGYKRQGFLVSTCGSQKPVFRCAATATKAFLDTLDAQYAGELLFAGMDEKGAILDHPTAMDEAFALGRNLCISEED